MRRALHTNPAGSFAWTLRRSATDPAYRCFQSQDGDWIAFASGRETPAEAFFPYGSTLFIAHPDGSDLHSVRPATGDTMAHPCAWLP